MTSWQSPAGPSAALRPPRRRLRRTLVVLAVVSSVLLAGGVYVYTALNGNIRSSPLFAGVTGNAGAEKVDPFGRSPINILVIGSDARNGPSNCKLGGDCRGGGMNADVQMIVHVAADRSNATVLSVPRDTVTELPGCRDQTGAMEPHVGLINSTLAYGPGCTVAAVHALTGIPIDHFAMVDFSGVVTMSDAVGGASVCVTNNVFDPYSHLKLAKGWHSLKGLAALEFVRSRHAFGDGSDLGRTYAQHMFLSAVIRSLKSTGVLANPATMYSLASAATRAVTVDSGLAGIPQLLGLAADIDKVPTRRITFTTMPNAPDPANAARVVVAPTARALFESISNDQALTPASAAGAGMSPSPSTTPIVPSGVKPGRIAIRILNGSGRPGRAAAIAAALANQGFTRTTVASAPAPSLHTTLRYPLARQGQAQLVAQALGLAPSALRQSTGTTMTVTIGSDWTVGTRFDGAPAMVSPARTQAALTQAHVQTADQAAKCTPVSTLDTVVYQGVGMSPVRAYAVSRQVPVSAP